ncbi:hypothetical protein LOK49_LG08G01615 [Camellia lanceoleosa]|uniref:Uncharacterized protein n=1 Tax=Camellia lanceoleosa TaxID=1840588 RepID=A0ACC0GTT9_9ERIC|nr:hypothetical protein LOK49_LG08G01615 [Camellia lanceoleosa]
MCISSKTNQIYTEDNRFKGNGFSKDSKQLDAEVHRKYIYGGHVAAYMKILMEDEPEKYHLILLSISREELSLMALRSCTRKFMLLCSLVLNLLNFVCVSLGVIL